MSKSREEKLHDVERVAPLAGPEGEVAALAAGAAAQKEHEKENRESWLEKGKRYRENTIAAKQAVVGAGSIAFPFILGVFVFLADALYAGFSRSGNALYIYGVAYAVVGFVTYLSLKSSVDSEWLWKHCAVLTGISWLLPVFLSLAAGFLSENAYMFAGYFTADLLAKLMSPYMPLIFIYLVGWPKFLFQQAASAGGALGKIASVVHGIAIFVIFLAVLLPFMSALQSSELAQQAGVTGYEFEQVSFKKLALDSWGLIADSSSSVWRGVTGQVNESFTSATARPYTGTVERQQGQLLGVNVKGVQAVKPVFYYTTKDDQLSTDNGDKQVLWFGTVEARTFADDMDVSLGCVYEYTPQGAREEEQISTSARPEEISVSFTGEFVDSWQFNCQMDMQEILEKAGERATQGQFYTSADFSFQTWGYSTVTFMDRSAMTALRREGKNPSQVLGIDPYVQAKYTPGPISLGMLEKQSLPLGVDLENPDSNTLPYFGVTLQNSWYGRGEVTDLHELVLQVPEPLVLDTRECAGYDGPVRERLSGYVHDDEVPPGYRWYILEDIAFDEDQQLKTIRCPLRVQAGEWGRLLGPDLSAREFTLVARAKYDYSSQTRVHARLGVERLPE